MKNKNGRFPNASSFATALFALILVLIVLIIMGCEQTVKVDPAEASKTAHDILDDGIRTGSESTRQTIVRLASSMEVDEALPLLNTALTDRQPKIVESALARIINFQDPSSLEIIRAELGNTYDRELIDILIDLEADDIEENIKKGMRGLDQNNRGFAVEQYGKYIGSDAEETLIKYLDDDNYIVQVKSRLALARLGNEIGFDDIPAFLESDNIVPRAGAIIMIEEFELKEYRDELYDIAKDGYMLDTSEALRVLYQWGDEESYGILKDKLEHTDIYSMYNFLQMIEEKHDLKMIGPLRRMMSSASPNERYAAARLIVTLDAENNPDALEFLLKGLESDIPPLRQKLIESLANLPNIPEVYNILITKGLKDEEAIVIQSAISTLGKIGDMETINNLAPFLEDDKFEIRASAAAAVLNIMSREKSGKK